jgi:hypothetical protein
MKRSSPPTRRAAPKRSGKPIPRGKRAKRRYVTKGGRNSDPEKLAWLRECRECLCAADDGDFCAGPVEAHHERRRGARATDKRALPLCAHGHHKDGPRSRHVLGPARFEQVHRLSLEAECTRYEVEWQRSKLLSTVVAHRAGAAG